MSIEGLTTWLKTTLKDDHVVVKALTGDASFRKYFRVLSKGSTYIAVDAPPDLEDLKAFADIAMWLKAHDLVVPEILGSDYHQGYLLQTDFGDELFSAAIQRQEALPLYQDALHALTAFQCIDENPLALLSFDSALYQIEYERTLDWFFARYMSMPLNASQTQLCDDFFHATTYFCNEQPQVLVHRDYHSRNLMLVNQKMGMIDFQDARMGPLTYDAGSLLKDSYVVLDNTTYRTLLSHYYDKTVAAGLHDADLPLFEKWLDMVGMQRHFKNLTIFARLFLRDQKKSYLQYLPNNLNYLIEASIKYPETAAFGAFLSTEVMERFEVANEYVHAAV